MPGYVKHFQVGFIITLIIGTIFILLGFLDLSIKTVITLLIISFVYSLLPDIDIGTSKIRKAFVTFFVIYLFIKGLTPLGYFLAIILLVIQFIHHRGIMHSIIIGILLSGLLYFIDYTWTFSIIAIFNFASHLILDGEL